jgi:CheY-like chemotaxis protein
MSKAGVAIPIRVASDGQEAIDYLRGAGKFADRAKFPFPCLVLLDLKLPYVMGLDVLKWIRKKVGMDLAVLLVTASAQDADIATAYRLGANGFLVKPSEASKLEDMVKAISDFWLTHNTFPQEPPPRGPGERDLRPVHSATNGFATKRRRSVNGAHREPRARNPKPIL